MKPYFAKYLPVEGELKVGDKVENVESTMEFDEFYDSGMWGGID